jgi:hypothetical protein
MVVLAAGMAEFIINLGSLSRTPVKTPIFLAQAVERVREFLKKYQLGKEDRTPGKSDAGLRVDNINFWDCKGKTMFHVKHCAVFSSRTLSDGTPCQHDREPA